MKITSSKFHVHFGEQMSNVEYVVTSPESINLGSMLTYILYCYHMLSHFGVPMWILSLLKLLGMAIEAPRWKGHLVSWYVRKPRSDVDSDWTSVRRRSEERRSIRRTSKEWQKAGKRNQLRECWTWSARCWRFLVKDSRPTLMQPFFQITLTDPPNDFAPLRSVLQFVLSAHDLCWATAHLPQAWQTSSSSKHPNMLWKARKHTELHVEDTRNCFLLKPVNQHAVGGTGPHTTVDGRNIQTPSIRYNPLAPKFQC